MTPSYKKQYAAAFKQLVKPNAGGLMARVVADVKASGVSHADPDRVKVLLYVNQTTTSTANGGEPQRALNRVLFSMKRADTDAPLAGRRHHRLLIVLRVVCARSARAVRAA